MSSEFEYLFKPYDGFRIGDSMTFSKTFSAEEVKEFAELTGDLNPLHIDEAFAAGTYFGTRLVHGAFVNAVCGKGIAPFTGTASINMGQEWTCPAPTRVGDTVTYEILVADKNDEKHDLFLKLTGTRQDGTVVFSATNRVKIMDKKKK